MNKWPDVSILSLRRRINCYLFFMWTDIKYWIAIGKIEIRYIYIRLKYRVKYGI